MSMPALKGSPLPPAKKAAGGLAGTLEANKKPLLVAGAGLVAVLALLRRRAAGGDTAPEPEPTFAGQSTAGPYDTSGNDVYNALQPQIEQTQSMLKDVIDRLGPNTIPTTPKPTTPTPTPTTPRVPTPTPPKPPAKPGPVKKPTPAPVKKPPTTVYVVKKGDSLSKIGAQFGVSWASIYAANRGVIGSNPNLIKPGQRLTIPAKK